EDPRQARDRTCPPCRKAKWRPSLHLCGLEKIRGATAQYPRRAKATCPARVYRDHEARAAELRRSPKSITLQIDVPAHLRGRKAHCRHPRMATPRKTKNRTRKRDRYRTRKRDRKARFPGHENETPTRKAGHESGTPF